MKRLLFVVPVLAVLAGCAALFALMTCLSARCAMRRFEQLDL
mgnify:CR=1 FL=1